MYQKRIKNLFKPIRVINRTNPWAIWTPTSEDIDHLKKMARPPPKKNSHMFTARVIQHWGLGGTYSIPSYPNQFVHTNKIHFGGSRKPFLCVYTP